MRPQLDEQSVINANQQFSEQMLAMKLEAIPCAGELSVGAGHLLGSVALTGMWKGRIEVRMGDGLAYEATADSLAVAFRHAAGELMVRVWEQEYADG